MTLERGLRILRSLSSPTLCDYFPDYKTGCCTRHSPVGSAFDYLNNTSTATKRGRIPDPLADQVEENDPRERSYGSYLGRNEDIKGSGAPGSMEYKVQCKPAA